MYVLGGTVTLSCVCVEVAHEDYVGVFWDFAVGLG